MNERVIDVRAYAGPNGRQKVYLKLQGDGGQHLPDVAAGIATVMVAAFRSGKQCLWDDAIFSTAAVLPQISNDAHFDPEIRSWELALDPTADHVDLYVGFAAGKATRSSGLPEHIVWSLHRIPADRVALILEIVQSRYSKYEGDEFANTDVGSLDSD